jgi:TusA-related sulfurtransferase
MSNKIINLNISGQICPACLLIALKEINTHRKLLKSGKACLVVRTDHRDATRTIPNAAAAMGYTVSVAKREGSYEITIKQDNEDRKES